MSYRHGDSGQMGEQGALRMSLKWRLPENLARSRPISAAELALGIFCVIGYNVFHIVPNEVLILFALGIISARLRNGGLSALGLKRPASWSRVILIAVIAAVVRNVLGEGILAIAEVFWPNPQLAPEWASELTGNVKFTLLILLVVWTFAAFGEEIAYRGYLVLRTADLSGGSKAAYWIGVVVVAVLFGYGHYYKGPAGMIDSGFGGLVFGAAYLLAGRNLWAAILAHGFVDTYGVILLFFGWAE